MPLFLDLARRVASTGLDLLVSVTRDQELQAVKAEMKAEMKACGKRMDTIEAALGEQAEGLDKVRDQVTSLIAQLNDRLLPGIDERIHETERDLTRLASRMVQGDQDSLRREVRLTTAEQRVADLREKVGRLEQRTGLWREVQANVARLGEDVDALRARLPATRRAESLGKQRLDATG